MLSFAHVFGHGSGLPNLDRIAAEIALAPASARWSRRCAGEMFAKRQVLADAWDAYCNETGEVMTFPSVDGRAPLAPGRATANGVRLLQL